MKNRKKIRPAEFPREASRRLVVFDESRKKFQKIINSRKVWVDSTGSVHEVTLEKDMQQAYWRRYPKEEPGGLLWISIVGVKVPVHALAWCAWNSVVYTGEVFVEHINGDFSDNRPENLRARFDRSKGDKVIEVKTAGGKIKKRYNLDMTKYKSPEEYEQDLADALEKSGGDEDSLINNASVQWREPEAVDFSRLEEVQETIVNYLKAGAHLETAVLAAGVSRNVFHSWIRDAVENPDSRFQRFSDKVDQAVSQWEVLMAGKVTTAAGRNWQAASWLLERKHPDKWGRRDGRHAAGPEDLEFGSSLGAAASGDIDLSKLSDEELDQLEKMLEKSKKEGANGDA